MVIDTVWRFWRFWLSSNLRGLNAGQEVDSRIMRLLGFGLAGFEPGDYSLTLRVTDEVAHESREVREPFVVVP